MKHDEIVIGMTPLEGCPQVWDAKDVQALVLDHQSPREELYILHVMPDMRVHFLQRAAVGGTQSICFDTSDVLRSAILSKAKAIVLAHTHPYEESVRPSKTDLDVTQRLVNICEAARIPLLDHVIVGKTGCYSMAAHGVGGFVGARRYRIQPQALHLSGDTTLSASRGFGSDFILNCPVTARRRKSRK